MKKLLIVWLFLNALQGFSQSIKATYTSTSGSAPPSASTNKPVPYIFAYKYCNGKSLSTLISGPQPRINRTGPAENIFYKDKAKNIIK